jgi:hypothetical protein
MRISEAIGFVFEDEQWLSKLLLGALISLIPIFGGAVLMGYAIAVLRNLMAGSHCPLPSWDRIGQYFVDGLLFWVALLVYSIPLLLLLCPIGLVWILPAVGGESEEAVAVLSSIAGLVGAGLGCLGFLYGVLLWLLSPVLQIQYAETGDLATCFRFGEVFRFFFDHIGAIVIAQVLVAVAGFVVSSVLGSVIGVIGLVPICGWVVAGLLALAMIPVGFWLMLVGAHLYAQIGHETTVSSSIV